MLHPVDAILCLFVIINANVFTSKYWMCAPGRHSTHHEDEEDAKTPAAPG